METTPNILIVSGDRHLRKTLTDDLQANGHALEVMATAEIAPDQRGEDPPQVVVIDLNPDDTHGLHVVRKIKTQWPDVACIILADNASSESTMKAVDLGAYGYIHKPYDVNQLRLLIQRALEKREVSVALQKSEDRFHALLGTSPDAVFITDREGNFKNIAPNSALVFDHTPDELRGLGKISRILGDDFRDLGELKTTGQLNNIERSITNRSGTIRSLLINLKYLPGDNVLCVCRDITAQKQAEAALHKSEERFRILSELITDYAYSIAVHADGTTSIEWITEAFTQITGFTPEEVEAEGQWQLVVHPDDHGFVAERVEALYAGQEDIREYRIVTKSGETRWLREYVKPIWTETHERIVRIYGAAQDITVQKQAEMTLRESESRYRSVTESAADAIIIVDSAGKITSWNTSAERLFGHKAEEVLEEPLTMLMPERFRERHEQGMRRLRSTGEHVLGQTIELQGLRKNGEEFPSELSLSTWTIRGEIHFGAIIRDITERKKAQEALAKERNLLRTLIDNIPDYIFVKDQEGRFILSNRAHAAGAGVTPEELVGKKAEEVFAVDDAQQLHGDDEVVLQTGQMLVNQERFTSNQNGEKKWVLTTKVPLRDRQGTITGLVGITRDVTERKQVEEKLKRSTADLAQAQQIAGMGSWVWDLRTNQVQCSDEMYRILGLVPGNPDSVTYETFLSRVHPDDRESTESQLIVAGEKREFSPFVYRTVPIDGTVRSIQAYGEVICDETGQPVKMIGVDQDITERKQAEEALHYQATLLENVSDAVISADMKFVVRSWNRAAETLYGWTADEAIGRNFTVLVNPQYPGGVTREEVIREFIETGMWRGEVIHYRKDGSPINMLGAAAVLSDRDGNQTGLVAAYRDISKRKATEDALRKRSEEITLLYEAGKRLGSTLELDAIYDTVHAVVSSAMSCDCLIVSSFDEESQVVRCVYARLDGKRLDASEYPPLVLNPDSNVIQTGEGLKLPDFRAQAKPTHMHDLDAKDSVHDLRGMFGVADNVKSALIVPLNSEGRVIGIIQVFSYQLAAYSDENLRLLEALSPQVATATINADLYRQVTDQNTRLGEIVAQRTAQLERTNDRLATILNNTSDAILLLDAGDRIQNTNLAFDDTFGYQRDELFDKPISVLAETDQQDLLINALQSARRTRLPQRSEITMRRKNGQVFETDIAIAFVKDNGGHSVCSIRDITHLKEVQRVKDQFVSMVSHELRTPITTIMLGANSLRKYYDRLGDDRKRQKIDQIAQQTETLADLVTAILDISRIGSRQGKRGHDTVDVARALHEVVTDLTDEAREKSHHIDVQIFNQIMTVRGEHVDIARVWRNLLNNAIKYTDNGGTIQVALYGAYSDDPSQYDLPDLLSFTNIVPSDLSPKQHIIGLVEDNGPGIRPQDLDQLFTRFFRGWAAGTNISGTGLGLSLVRDILHLYGGDIAVSSELDVGTTFCFWLPADEVKGSTQ